LHLQVILRKSGCVVDGNWFSIHERVISAFICFHRILMCSTFSDFHLLVFLFLSSFQEKLLGFSSVLGSYQCLRLCCKHRDSGNKEKSVTGKGKRISEEEWTCCWTFWSGHPIDGGRGGAGAFGFLSLCCGNVKCLISWVLGFCFVNMWKVDIYMYIPVAVGTKNNVIFKSFANESAGSIIKCIAISFWTSLLEKGGIIGWLACSWIGKFSTAAILIRSKCLTSTFTPNYTTLVSISSHHLKFFWTTY